jgi:hypothetical protein
LRCLDRLARREVVPNSPLRRHRETSFLRALIYGESHPSAERRRRQTKLADLLRGRNKRPLINLLVKHLSLLIDALRLPSAKLNGREAEKRHFSTPRSY